MADRFIRFFAELSIDDVPLVGGKNASLGEMYRLLTPQGIKIPNGFAITAEAYCHALDQAGAWEKLHQLLDDISPDDLTELKQRARKARQIVYEAGIPDDLHREIIAAYQRLAQEYGEAPLSVAVRSSATAEDLPTASFAGQQESYLNICGEEALIEAVRRCFASLFTERAIHYRIDQGFDHFNVYLSVCVQKMVRSDLGASGVMFSIDTESGFPEVVFINAAFGLGETVVQGAVDPDEFYVFKPTLRQGYRAVLRRRRGTKKVKMILATDAERAATRIVPTPDAEQQRFSIDDRDVLILADYAMKVEDHYGRPMDIEWAKDGIDGQIYLLQARPETSVSQQNRTLLEEFHLIGTGTVLVEGRAVGNRIASGKVRILDDVTQLHGFQPGDVLVADMTSPDWEPVMKIAAAIITNRGGRTCHAAIVARELGIPAVVGTGNATAVLENGQLVTVSCAEGEIGRVYDGKIPYQVETTDLSNLPKPKTRLMVNLGNPDIAFHTASLPADGVGLARMEFIINEYIKVHPMALVYPERVKDADERRQIDELVRQDKRPRDFFIRTLAEGVGTIAAAFYPKPVVVRMSDFKSNEYAALLGGRWFEPTEANPMLGFRGAARYIHPDYVQGFAMECAAMKYVREVMGLSNVILMLPFVRRLDEAQRVLAKMAEWGLARGTNGLKIYCMCELPNNVILIDQFARHFDGFSIGSNDLTQLVLGVDRDSQQVAFDYDERDEGVKTMLKMAIDGCRRQGVHSGICGQAPSDYPEMAEFLVRCGIDSMSINPDTFLKTLRLVVDVEERLGN